MTIHYYPTNYKANKSKFVYCGRRTSWYCIGNNGAKFASDDINKVNCLKCLSKYQNRSTQNA